MLYELIADSERVTEAIARDYSDRDHGRITFRYFSDDAAARDRDPLGEDSRIGERISEGFALMGFSE